MRTKVLHSWDDEGKVIRNIEEKLRNTWLRWFIAINRINLKIDRKNFKSQNKNLENIWAW
jgi:hypothetical protein